MQGCKSSAFNTCNSESNKVLIPHRSKSTPIGLLMPHSLHKKIKGDDGLIIDVPYFQSFFLIWQGFFGSCSNNVLCHSDIYRTKHVYELRDESYGSIPPPLPLRSAHVTHVEIRVKT